MGDRKKTGKGKLSKVKAKLAKAKATAKEDGVLDSVARAAGWVAGVLESDAALTPTRDLFGSIRARRSHKRFKPAPVDAAEISMLLDAAVTAPNHKMTEPWGFVVLGARTRRSYATCKARLRYGDQPEGEGSSKAEQMVGELMGVPAVIGVTQKLDDDPVRREEDYAAVFMAIENMLLAATALGLGTKVQTGNILDDAAFRSELGLRDRERLVALVHVGHPSEDMPAKKRAPASEKTRWLD